MIAIPRAKCLNAGKPINWDHPLNRSLISRWQVIPQAAGMCGWGSLTLRDMCRTLGGSKNDLTLNALPTWATERRPGGLGAMQFLAASVQSATATITQFSGATQISMAGWFHRTATNVRLSTGIEGAGTTDRFSIDHYTDSVVYLEVGNGANTQGSFSLADVVWHHIAMVYDGSQSGVDANALQGYVDGVPKTLSFSGGSIPATLAARTDFATGRQTTNNPSSGSVDDLRIWTRPLAAVDVWTLYTDSLRGSPETLNWIGTRTWFVNKSAVIAPQAMHQRRMRVA